jgi:hypothetical protein
MAKPTPIDELRATERRLQAAQLAGDTTALEQLLDDRLLFTFGPTGACYTKHDDLWSSACRWTAKPRTTDSRAAHQRGPAEFGELAQTRACSIVSVAASCAAR